MYEKHIVRADFYPNGQIIPLGFTDDSGKTFYVNRILSVSYKKTGEEIVRCIISNRKHTFVLKNNKWRIYVD